MVNAAATCVATRLTRKKRARCRLRLLTELRRRGARCERQPSTVPGYRCEAEHRAACREPGGARDRLQRNRALLGKAACGGASSCAAQGCLLPAKSLRECAARSRVRQQCLRRERARATVLTLLDPRSGDVLSV